MEETSTEAIRDVLKWQCVDQIRSGWKRRSFDLDRTETAVRGLEIESSSNALIPEML